MSKKLITLNIISITLSLHAVYSFSPLQNFILLAVNLLPLMVFLWYRNDTKIGLLYAQLEQGAKDTETLDKIYYDLTRGIGWLYINPDTEIGIMSVSKRDGFMFYITHIPTDKKFYASSDLEEIVNKIDNQQFLMRYKLLN